MKIYFSQLQRNLEKKIFPVYMLLGDEPLQQIEGGELIRTAIKATGPVQRDTFYVDSKFKWDSVYASAGNASLFCDKHLLEIDFGATPVKKEASNFFKAYLESSPENKILVLHLNKVDRRLAWVKKFEAQGLLVQIYNKNLSELQAWLRERMLKQGLKMEDHVVDSIALRVEGNMLAAAQEVTKLSLLCEDKLVRLEDVECSVGLSSRYSAFDFVDAAIAADLEKAVRMLYCLRLEEFPVPLLVGALASELRRIAVLEHRRMGGESVANLLGGEWRNKKEKVRRALERRRGLRWESLLAWCAKVDKAAKGVRDSGDEVWNLLLILLLKTGSMPHLAKARS